MAGISNHYDSIIALQSLISGLSLPGITNIDSGASIVIQEVIDYRIANLTLPCVLIAPFGAESYDPEGEYVDLDGPIYGIAVAIVADPKDTRYSL